MWTQNKHLPIDHWCMAANPWYNSTSPNSNRKKTNQYLNNPISLLPKYYWNARYEFHYDLTANLLGKRQIKSHQVCFNSLSHRIAPRFSLPTLIDSTADVFPLPVFSATPPARQRVKEFDPNVTVSQSPPTIRFILGKSILIILTFIRVGRFDPNIHDTKNQYWVRSILAGGDWCFGSSSSSVVANLLLIKEETCPCKRHSFHTLHGTHLFPALICCPAVRWLSSTERGVFCRGLMQYRSWPRGSGAQSGVISLPYSKIFALSDMKVLLWVKKYRYWHQYRRYWPCSYLVSDWYIVLQYHMPLTLICQN